MYVWRSLDRLIHQHQSAPEIVAAGHEQFAVDRVVKLVTIAEFKRRQAPPRLKITARVFGTGWRMSIATKWVARTARAIDPAKQPSQPV